MLNTDWREKRPAVAARLDIVDAQLDAAWTLKDCCAPATRKKERVRADDAEEEHAGADDR